jgi:hypothetical protein
MKVFLIVGALLVLLLGLVYTLGYILPSKLVIQKTNLLPYSIDKVWDLTRDIKGQKKWRSDIELIEILESTKTSEKWKELPKKGPEMIFQSTKVEEPNYWRMDMVDTKGFSAYWIGKYSSEGTNQTKITFTEYVEYPSPFLRVFAKLFVDLDSIMETYQKDMKSELERRHGKQN